MFIYKTNFSKLLLIALVASCAPITIPVQANSGENKASVEAKVEVKNKNKKLESLGRIAGSICRSGYWCGRAASLAVSGLIVAGGSVVALCPALSTFDRTLAVLCAAAGISSTRALYKSLRYGDKEGHDGEKPNAQLLVKQDNTQRK